MGTSIVGIAHAAIVAHMMHLPMGYVRGGNKDHGRQNRMEGKLEKGQTLTLKDIQLPKGVEAVLHGHNAEDTVLVSVVMPAAAEAEPEPTPAAAPAAGDAAADGDKK